MVNVIEPQLDAGVLGRWLDDERCSGRRRGTVAATAQGRLAEHPVSGRTRRSAHGAANAGHARRRGPHRRAVARNPVGAGAVRHRRAACRADRGRRDRHRAGHAVLRDARDRRVEPDGRRLAGAVRHRLVGPARTGVRARRGRRQAGPGGLARPGTRRLRPPRRIPRTAGRSLAEVPGRLQGARPARPGRGRQLVAR